MALETCPLPQVEEALRPYIKSREEVSAIRRQLQNYLETQLQAEDIPLQTVTLPIPSTIQLDTPAPALSGVRKAYWKALQAHAEAQAKYDALRSDLEQLKHRRSETAAAGNQARPSVNENYIPLLRQREKQRKLKAVERAYEDVSAAGDDLYATSVEDVVKKQIGELPAPPTTQQSATQNTEAETRILELKKTLISMTRKVEERKTLASSRAASTQDTSPAAEIAGLQAALQELTGWMETQLSIIAEAETEPRAAVEDPDTKGTTHNPVLASADIEALYERYLDSRTLLIDAVNSPAETQTDSTIEDITGQPSRWTDTKTLPKTSAEIVLPYLPILLGAKQHEQALVQQSTHIRRQMTSAEAETERLIRRLAEESHLVQPGGARGENWARAAKEAAASTSRFINERVQAGETSAVSAREALEKIERLPKSIDQVSEWV